MAHCLVFLDKDSTVNCASHCINSWLKVMDPLGHTRGSVTCLVRVSQITHKKVLPLTYHRELVSKVYWAAFIKRLLKRSVFRQFLIKLPSFDKKGVLLPPDLNFNVGDKRMECLPSDCRNTAKQKHWHGGGGNIFGNMNNLGGPHLS